MRQELKELQGIRDRFSGVVERFGEKPSFRGYPKKTVLLKDITHLQSKKQVTDHLWFTIGKRLEELKVGDLVEFDARVTTYEKGYKGYRDDVFCPIEIDYRLERPTKVQVVNIKNST